MLPLHRYVSWDVKYAVMEGYYDNFLSSRISFKKLLISFSNLDGIPRNYEWCDFSQKNPKGDSEYFGEGVRFSMGFDDWAAEVIVDFETFLQKLREVVDVYLEVYQIKKEEKKEIEDLYQLIRKRVLA